MMDRTLTRLGRISLCSRNCRITFRKYSRLTSSSLFDCDGAGEAVREGVSEDTEVRDSVEGESCLDQ